MDTGSVKSWAQIRSLPALCEIIYISSLNSSVDMQMSNLLGVLVWMKFTFLTVFSGTMIILSIVFPPIFGWQCHSLSLEMAS